SKPQRQVWVEQLPGVAQADGEDARDKLEGAKGKKQPNVGPSDDGDERKQRHPEEESAEHQLRRAAFRHPGDEIGAVADFREAMKRRRVSGACLDEQVDGAPEMFGAQRNEVFAESRRAAPAAGAN